MYINDNHDINRPTESFVEWATSFDAWLDTDAGRAWLNDQSEAMEMALSAERYESHPGMEYAA